MPRHRSPFARVKKPLKSDMNVVPYIDVMLVLLVIFMVTAPMITTGISVDLPKANSNSIESKSTPAIVTIKADGSYYLQLNGHGGNDALSLEDVKNQLADAQKAAEEKQQKLMVLVNGSRHVDYEAVVKLMSNLQDAGLQQVGLLTDPPRQ